jgi:hypothetical protein
MPKHKTGDTQAEKEIVLAWEKCLNEWHVALFTNYEDEYYIHRMLDDIGHYRAKTSQK